jgi:hypothetical protein
MEVVLVPAKTTVQINGIAVKLAVETLVEVAYDDMKHLTGYHYAHLPDVPEGATLRAVPPRRSPGQEPR